MALYRESKVNNSTGLTVNNIVRKNYNSSALTIQDGLHTKYYHRLSFRESSNYIYDKLHYSANGISVVFVAIMLLLIFANIFSVNNAVPSYGELRPITEMTFDSFVSTLSDSTDIDFIAPLKETFNAATSDIGIVRIPNSNNSSFLGSVEDILNSILGGFKSLINGVIFALDLIVNLIQMVFNLFKILALFFT